MYEFIEGIVEEKTITHAVIASHGIGYFMHIPINCFSQLPELGEPARLYTSFIVREDSQRLFAFHSRAERDLFNILKEVSGVGPKTALALVGHIERDAFFGAVHSGCAKTIAQVPGIGKKTAERLIVELKDKKVHAGETPLKTMPKDQVKLDAIAALINLGYSSTHAEKAVEKKYREDITLPDLITQSLRN